MTTGLPLLAAALAFCVPVQDPYPGWNRSGSVFLITTPEGADLPASASEEAFPVLLRLHRDTFDFSQAMPGGEDLRVSAEGKPLAFQVEDWDAAAGRASVWVRVPRLRGNARQELRLHWGRPGAASESSGPAVFGGEAGYLAVWHLGSTVRDELGALESKDTGTTPAAGVIGGARRFEAGKGIHAGEKISLLPTGSESHSSEAWFRAERSNGVLLGWGNEHAQGKVVMKFAAPPHIRMDCYFSGADVRTSGPMAMSDWIHVLHTYRKGESRLYVNGVLDGASTTPNSPLAIKSPARAYLGGWYNTYSFVGELDEVRISKVVRSADWARLQYENQKPLQTLAGHVVQPGDAFSVSPASLALREGGRAAVTAVAGGAQKVYWLLVRDGRETVVGVDRLTHEIEAGRVSGDQAFTLRFKAVYPDRVRTLDVPVTVREALPDPAFTLAAPEAWDGRAPIEVDLRVSGDGPVNASWSVPGIAVIKEALPGKLRLLRAMKSGELTVTATLDNGGAPVSRSVRIRVQEPAKDPWIPRPPERDEKPEEGQFIARDDRNEGVLPCTGVLPEPADAVFLRVFAGDRLHAEDRRPLAADRVYALSVKLAPGLIRYRAEFGAVRGGTETVLHAAGNLMCGDVFLINGQSNAEATAFGKDLDPYTNEWVRSYGSAEGGPGPESSRFKGWAVAIRAGNRGRGQIGYWGLELGRRLVEAHQVPVCILNGAVGGTRIDQHQRNAADPEDARTIYGRLLWRVRQARLTHGVRAVLWHQGENDQGADGPTGRYGWETYREYFLDLAAAWKQDFPNLQRTYAFQIWPKACAMGVKGSDNRLREVQRTLPSYFSNLSVMSTLGVRPPGTCHYSPEGYADIARLIRPLLERDFHGKVFPSPITPPDLKSAAFAGEARDEIDLDFDQPVAWDDRLASQFTLDGERGRVVSGAVVGTRLRLRLSGPTQARTITYLDSASWSPSLILRGANDLAALTFCEVPIGTR